MEPARAQLWDLGLGQSSGSRQTCTFNGPERYHREKLLAKAEAEASPFCWLPSWPACGRQAGRRSPGHVRAGRGLGLGLIQPGAEKISPREGLEPAHNAENFVGPKRYHRQERWLKAEA